jgi:glycosyltransferase involved in cell wall biosynthesis
MGEYVRSLAIARAASRHWPGADIRFVLSSAAPYAADVPFPATWVASSPTFHSAPVIELLEKWRPDIVVFDNAGRTAQLRAARRLGARVVYISARRRQRRKAFRWLWMRLIDEHWIAYPEFIAGRVGFFESLKLKILGGPAVRFLDVILARGDTGRQGAILARIGCEAGSFVLVVPGGGTGHPGASDAADQFMAAARSLAAGGTKTVYVGPVGERADEHAGEHAAVGSARAAAEPNWLHLGPLPQDELAELMRAARLVVANGGSTLLQAIACGSACIAVPIAKDQTGRIRRCVAAGVAVAVARDSERISQAAAQLLRDEPQRAALARRASGLELADGVEIAMQSMSGLLEPPRQAVGP